MATAARARRTPDQAFPDGTYLVILTVSGPGGSDTDSVGVTVPCS